MAVTDDDRALPGADTELALAFAQIARRLAEHSDEDGIYGSVVSLALEVVDGVEHAGVFVLEDGCVRGRAVSDDFVTEIDALQLQAGDGPCLEAMFDPTVTYVSASDLMIAVEWPKFGPAAVQHGLRSVLSTRLFADRPVALNLYSRLPGAFGAVDRTKALILASHAGTALHAVASQLEQARTSENLRAGLEMRSIIGQAQGILMERERITAEQAFDVLRRASQNLNVKLRDIAQQLVETGSAPLPIASSVGE